MLFFVVFFFKDLNVREKNTLISPACSLLLASKNVIVAHHMRFVEFYWTECATDFL